MMANTPAVPVQVAFVLCDQNQQCPDLLSLRESTGFVGRPRIFTETFPVFPHTTPVHCPLYGLVGFFLYHAATRVVYFIFQSRTISLWTVQW